MLRFSEKWVFRNSANSSGYRTGSRLGPSLPSPTLASDLLQVLKSKPIPATDSMKSGLGWLSDGEA